jgi:hypothetical protein
MKSSQVALAAKGLGIFGAPTALSRLAEAADGHFQGALDEAWRRGQHIYQWGATAIAAAYSEASRLLPNVMRRGRPYVWNMHRAGNGGP